MAESALVWHATAHRGDLKVLGRVLPQHAHALRREVTVIPCGATADPAAEVTAALADGVGLVLLDDIDFVLRTDARAALRDLLARHAASFVVTCQDPERIADLLPSATHVRAMRPQPVEVF